MKPTFLIVYATIVTILILTVIARPRAMTPAARQ
jgi:hypothetical protein